MKYKRAAGIRETAGFTLVEMALVVALVGLSLSLSLPYFSKPLALYRLKLSAQQMAQDLREVQQTAINEESSYYSVFFAVSNNYYEVQKVGEVLPKITKRAVLPPTVKIVFTSFKDDWLKFTAQGTPTPTGGTVVLQDKVSGQYFYVIVASVTGRIRVSSTPPDNWGD